MNTSHLTVFLFFILLLSQCSFRQEAVIDQESNFHHIKIPADTFLLDTHPKKLSELFRTTKLIPLETNENCLIGRIGKLITHDKRIYVLNLLGEEVAELLVFDEEGHFIRQIGDVGRGPNEAVILKDFALDKIQNEIILLDSYGRKLLFFDTEGEFLRKAALPNIGFTKIEHVEKDLLALVTFSNHLAQFRLLLMDKNAILKDKLFPYDDFNRMDIQKPLISKHDELLYTQSVGDTIYRVHQEGVSVYAYIDYGPERLKREDMAKIPFFGFEIMMPKDTTYSHDTRYYTENEQYIHFVYTNNVYSPHSPIFAFYDKRRRETKILTNHIFDDITFYPYAPQIETVNDKGEFIAILQPYLLLQQVEIMSDPNRRNTQDVQLEKRYTSISALCSRLNPSANPVIAYYTMK